MLECPIQTQARIYPKEIALYDIDHFYTYKELDDFIDNHIWEPFENLDPSFIWDQILNLAKSMRDYMEDSNA